MEVHGSFFSHLPVQIHRGGRDHIGLGVGHFGGSKLLAEFCAKPLLHYTLQATSGLFADRVVVTRSAEAAHFAQSCGVRTVLHTLPARCDAVRLGVQALKSGLARRMLCKCDLCLHDGSPVPGKSWR